MANEGLGNSSHPRLTHHPAFFSSFPRKIRVLPRLTHACSFDAVIRGPNGAKVGGLLDPESDSLPPFT